MRGLITCVLFLLALGLAACGGSPGTVSDDPLPTLAADPADSPQADITTEASVQDVVPSAEIDPETLPENSFRLEVVDNNDVAVTLEPFTADDENAKLLYVIGDYSIMDFMEPPYRQISFTRVTRDNPDDPDSGMTSSDVKLQLPMDVEPGTYSITTMAPQLDDPNAFGGWVSVFDGEYAIYDQYEGTITLTAIDDETVTGSFSLVGRSPDGYRSTVQGAFNQLSSTDFNQ